MRKPALAGGRGYSSGLIGGEDLQPNQLAALEGVGQGQSFGMLGIAGSPERKLVLNPAVWLADDHGDGEAAHLRAAQLVAVAATVASLRDHPAPKVGQVGRLR